VQSPAQTFNVAFKAKAKNLFLWQFACAFMTLYLPEGRVRVCVVFPDVFCSLQKSAGVNILQARERVASDPMGFVSNPLQIFPLLRGTAGEPQGAAISQETFLGGSGSPKGSQKKTSL